MNTPIYDFVKAYRDLRPARFHMPGHKGRGPLGCEDLDLTEIPGADSLYEAAGIIAESEANASKLFGCPTFYSTEGSSHCIRAMLLIASRVAPAICRQCEQNTARWPADCRHYKGLRVLAARNVHSAFLTAAALLDLDVAWLPTSGGGSYLSAHPTPGALDAALAETGAAAVYLSCPDYLGELPDLRPLAAVCHARGALLLVDNAHGAYLRFLTPSRHPMDLGADLCCDSAHKTLPVLTGGAYLHVSEKLLEATGNRQQATDPPVGVALTRRVSDPLRREAEERRTSNACPYEPGRETRPLRKEDVRDALALFGSTSPSYLILQSLDLANPRLETLSETLAAFLPKVEALKARLTAAGWRLTGSEPLKLTISLVGAAKTSPACRAQQSGGLLGVSLPLSQLVCDNWHPQAGGPASRPVEGCRPPEANASDTPMAAALEQEGIFCEFADPEHVVFMLSPNNTDEELARLEAALVGAAKTSPACRAQQSGGLLGVSLPLSQLVCDNWHPQAGGPASRPVEGCRPPEADAFDTGDGSLCSFKGNSNGAAGEQHREPSPVSPLRFCSLRDAMLSPAVRIPAGESLGRVLARPGVSCPPAVPILMPGEVIDEAAVEAFARYGIGEVSVLL